MTDTNVALNHAISVMDKISAKAYSVKARVESVARSVGTEREKREVAELEAMLNDLEIFL